MTEVRVPELSLVLLVGVSGSGKSTFAREKFAPYEALSSDMFRGLVSNDENKQAATDAAFQALRFVASQRLKAGLLTVVDATNVQSDARKRFVALAREHDVLPAAIVLDVPAEECVRRNAARPDRSFGAEVIQRQSSQLRRSLGSIRKEGFRSVTVLRGVDEIAEATIVRARLLNDARDEHGPFDAIGDVHGCLSELLTLLGRLGYAVVRDEAGRAVDAAHPEGRRVIFLGDLVDRGPDVVGVLRLAMGMVAHGNALAVPGNHEQKLVRALDGRRVQLTHGLPETLEQLAGETAEFRAEVRDFCYGLVSHLVLDDGRLVVAHAGLREEYQGRASARVRAFALYGETTGETDEYGLPVRVKWAEDYRGSATVLYGHTPMPTAEWVNNTMCLDTGCVFGGALSALRYPERELVSVPAERVWYEPARPFLVDGADEAVAPAAARGDALRIDDVQGKRGVETELRGRITVREDAATAALEVMARWAIDPRRLLYLPPTMSPPEASRRDGFLEHPDEAFETFRQSGVRQLLCEEKHMGSRAVVLVTRVPERFGAPPGWRGTIHTRTGRAFFDEDAGGEATEQRLLAGLDAALESAGLWSELQSDWLLFDAELLPWSAKAGRIIREQFAAPAAAALGSLPAAAAALRQAEAAGLEVTALRERTERRTEDALAYRDAYRRYIGDPQRLRIAPFQLLAAEGRTFEQLDHAWHLGLADRLAAVAPELVAPTARIEVQLDDEASVAAAIEWWMALTDAGGEGMVVKPYGNLATPAERLPQPGIKVRGREYLRIIYGPEYLQPAHLAVLRDRATARKRSMALREYALGLEALHRFTAGEPLWRVHEAVFAVLAMESETVDPRL